MTGIEWTVIGVAVAIILLLVVWFAIHQRSLVTRAHIMQEAIRNHDLTFQLPTKHMFSGEKALQETLNQLGEHIREQVNLGEVESWEKLTRVLTHEIMNATAPIASISQSMLHHPAIKDSDLEEGINAIHNTVVHLNSFVDGYRKYSSLQKPVPQQVDLAAVVGEVEQLFQDVQWQNTLSGQIIIKTDPNLLRQILINLVKNAIEAGQRARPGRQGAALHQQRRRDDTARRPLVDLHPLLHHQAQGQRHRPVAEPPPAHHSGRHDVASRQSP